MLAVKNLEKLIKIENELKAQYESKLNAQAEEIANGAKKIAELQQAIEKQQQSLVELSAASSDSKRLEQTNRELSNRSENLLNEIESQKKRIKTMQKELAEERSELKKLRQFDAEKIKKNLVSCKKKLAEKTTNNDVLVKSLAKSKNENAELQREIKELTAKLAQFETNQDSETEEQATA